MTLISKSVAIEFQNNNITYKDGDTLLINFNSAWKSADSFTGYIETTTPNPTTNDYLISSLRWSTDNLTWSPWILMDVTPAGDKKFPNMDFTSGTDVWLEFRINRVSQPQPIEPNPIALNDITITWNHLQTESDHSAPAASICPGGGNYTGIKVDCGDGLFRPYPLMGPAIALFDELSLAVSEMFGHQVCYFKTTADQRSKDFVLKEYSLYNVTDVKNVRIVVPDNQFPDNAIQFTPFDMDFESPFEVQIVKEDFERAFGYCVRPEERDYLYFPLENRLYEIQSAYLFKDFMRHGTYYKVTLFKWQDKENVMREPGSTAATLTDELTENFDDLFKAEDEKEFTQITKPLQYNTINIGDWDFVRSAINEKLDIKKHDINNYFTIVAKYAYDLNTIEYNALGVRYKTLVNIPEDEDRVYTFWLQDNRKTFVNPELQKIVNEYPIGSPYQGLVYDTILDGLLLGTPDPTTGVTGPNQGLQINVQYGDTNGDGVYLTQGMEVIINSTSHQFNTNSLQPWPNQQFPNLLVDSPQYNQKFIGTERKWFAFVLSVSNTYGTVGLNVWEMLFDPAKPAYVQQTSQLKLIFGESQPHTKQSIDPGIYYDLIGAPLQSTNFRILTELINDENQPLMLNRYTVRDNQYAEMIDNALPPLNMTRESGR